MNIRKYEIRLFDEDGFNQTPVHYHNLQLVEFNDYLRKKKKNQKVKGQLKNIFLWSYGMYIGKEGGK